LSSQLNQRDLADNLKLHGIQAEIGNCEKEISEIAEKTNGFNMDLLKEKGALAGKEKEISKERERSRGKLSAHKVSISTLYRKFVCLAGCLSFISSRLNR
jgi:hypothetical protein